MAKDPLGLFPEAEKQPAQTKQSSGPGFLATLLIVVAVFAGAYVWQKGGIDFGGNDQHQEQNDGKKAKLDGGTLVFVHERNQLSIDQSEFLKGMDAYTKAKGISWRSLDDDLDEVKPMIAWAESKSVDPPFVMYANKDKTPVAAATFPKTEAELDKLFK